MLTRKTRAALYAVTDTISTIGMVLALATCALAIMTPFIAAWFWMLPSVLR